jgi:glycopeptide antibiotics resistance protein
MEQKYTKENKAIASTDRLASRLFFILTALFILFIMLASLTPGSGLVPLPEQSTILRFKSLLSLKDIYASHDLRDIDTFLLRDLAANVLLYIPLGIFLSLAVSWGKPRFLTLWLPFGFLVSLLMEVIQQFIYRNPDPVDLITNTIGFLFGFWIVVFAIKFVGLRPSTIMGLSSDQKLDSKAKSIAAFRFMYICVFFLVALLPFDISVSPSLVYGQLFPDRAGQQKIILDLLYHFHNWPAGGAWLFVEFLQLIPIAIFTSFLNGINKRLNPFSPIYICVVMVAASECAQIFILSRTTDVILFPMAMLAGILGWLMIKTWFYLQDTHDQSSLHPFAFRKKFITIVLLSYWLAVCLISWAPYQFEIHPRVVAKKILYESNVIPFQAHFSYHSLSSALDLIKEIGIYLPMGILITFLLFNYWPNISRLKGMILAGLCCGAFALFIELSQSVCIGRYVDVTDIILGGFGGISGAMLFRLFSRSASVSNKLI